MDVSIIIVSWNTREFLRNCLSSIYENAGEVDYEIIVVDNASCDGSGEMVQSFFPDVKLISNAVNKGLAAANNQGIKIAKGRYVLLLNSDTLICYGAIAKMIEYADGHPEAAVLGCQVWENESTIQPTSFCYPSLLNMLLRISGFARFFKYNRFFGREMMLWWKRDTARQVDVVSGMFMFVRRAAIDRVGMMDESYFLYFEETDWCCRFAKAGWKMLFWPGAKIMHLDGGNKSTDQNMLKMKIQYCKSMLLFFRKHYGSIKSVLARLLMSLDSALRCAAAIVLKTLLREKTSYKLGQWKVHWRTFKFCAFGSEPGVKNMAKFSKKLLWRLTETTEFICTCAYSVFLPVMHNKPRRVVIYYHSVKAKDVGGFEKQIRYLAENCRVVKASQINTAEANGHSNLVAITFDDAFESVAKNALPILKKYSLPAAVFVPTGALGKRPRWPIENLRYPDNEETVMSKGQISEFSGNGFEFFSHTVTHTALTELEEEKMRDELAESKKILERITADNVLAVSYPFGAYNEKVCEASKQAGYELGFTTQPCTVNCSAGSMQLGRFAVKPSDSLIKFKLKVSGAYQVSKYLRAAKALILGNQAQVA